MRKKSGPPRFTESQVRQSFWAKVEKTDTCWLWTAAIHNTGYGKFAVGGRSISAHRFSFFLHNGYCLESHLDVCHSCDVRHCVNPDHLFVGTRRDNMRDAKRKGRIAIGEVNGISRLTSEKVRKMRKLYSSGLLSYQKIADAFGCSIATAFNAITGRRWSHVK